MAWWLKAIPWSAIIANAPTIVDSAKKLLDKRRTGADVPAPASGSGSLEARIAGLESRERKMLELIESLARSNQQLIEAVAALRQRARILLGFLIVLAVGFLIALIRLSAA